MQMKDKVQMNLFGTFQITSSNGQAIELKGKKKQGLLAYLALSRDCIASRNQASSILWSQRDSEKQANPSLRTALSELRKVFCTAGHEDILKTNRVSISLNLEHLLVDTFELKRLAKSKIMGEKPLALELYRGDLLEDLAIRDQAFKEWINIERIHYKELYREILHELIEYSVDKKTYDDGIQIANRLLVLDNTDEAAHRALMRIHEHSGNHARALKQFQSCCDLLQQELETTPSTETINLYEEIKYSNQFPARGNRSQATNISDSVLRSRDSLSIGVAPFVGQGDKSDCKFLAAGVSEDILGALSKFRWMSVVPRSATFSLRHEHPSAVSIGQKLGLKYIIDGSVLQLEDSVRVTVELIEVGADKVLWSESYSGILDGKLGIQNKITAQIVSQIDARLRMNEVSQVLTWNTDSPKAYDCLMQGISNMHQMTKESFNIERNLFRKAIQLDQNFAAVYSWWALREIFYFGQGWESEAREGESPAELAEKAVSLDSGDAIALAICAHTKVFMDHDFDGAHQFFERSMKANPYSAFTWMLSSATFSYCGEPDEALRRLEHSTYLCPVEPLYEFMYSSARCLAHSFAREYKVAAMWGRRLVRECPEFSNGIKQLLVPLGHLGELDEAREYTRRLLELEPDFTIELFRIQRPFRHSEDREEFVRGLVKAGVPHE